MVACEDVAGKKNSCVRHQVSVACLSAHWSTRHSAASCRSISSTWQAGALTPLQKPDDAGSHSVRLAEPRVHHALRRDQAFRPDGKVKIPHHFVQAFQSSRPECSSRFSRRVRLANRPLHLTLDRTEEHLLAAYNALRT
jgi:hypothetical protein